MEEGLSFDNIMSDVEVDNLFSDYEPSDEQSDSNEGKENQEENNDNTAESINVDDLFEDSESVGSEEEDNKEKEAPDSNNKNTGVSPNSNFYSSIASALGEDGVFPDLSSDEIKEIKDAESLREAIDRQIKSQLDEKQKRIDEALGVGVEPDMIRQYENTLNYIDSITDDAITSEDEEGERLRKNLIYQDFINRGYSKERAEREVKKSLDAGTDIDDAKEALSSNKEFFGSQYKKLVDEAKAEEKKEQENKKKEAEDLRKSILDDNKAFGELDVDKNTRKKIYETITKPVYKDPESGNYYTAIQKYEAENRVEFFKNVGLIFTLTDGFKNLDGLVKNKVKKEVAKGIKNLENAINTTSRNPDGSLNFVNGRNDEDSFFKGYRFDI